MLLCAELILPESSKDWSELSGILFCLFLTSFSNLPLNEMLLTVECSPPQVCLTSWEAMAMSRRNSAPPSPSLVRSHIVPEIQLSHLRALAMAAWPELCCDCAHSGCCRIIIPTFPQQPNHLWANSVRQRLSLLFRFSSPHFEGGNNIMKRLFAINNILLQYYLH